jgi:hypothetical protein
MALTLTVIRWFGAGVALSPYARLGESFGLSCLGVAIVALGWAWRAGS